MDRTDYHWLIDRSDRIRTGIATAAAIFVTATPLVLAGLTFLSKVIYDSKPDEGLFVSEMILPFLLLGISWLCALFAAGFSLGAIAKANGFNLMDFPWQHPKNSLVDARIDSDDPMAQLNAAAEAQLQAGKSLREAGWSFVLTILFLIAAFVSRAGLA